MVIKRKAVIMAALLLFILVAGCRKDQTSTVPPPTETAMSDTDERPGSAVTSPASIAPAETTAPPAPERTTNPNLNQELIDFPDLDGFEKLVVDVESMVVYNNGLVSMAMQYIEATQEQLDELAQGGGPLLNPIIEMLVGKRTVSSSQLIDLPGLDRKGLELELRVDDGNEYIGMIIPSTGQVLALFGMSLPSEKQVLLDGYNQLIEKLTV